MEKTYSLLAPILRRLGIEDGVRQSRIQEEWPRLFQAPLVDHMSPGRLAEGELTVTVESPLWMQQLTFCKNDLIRKLAPFGVREVRFRVGRVRRVRKPAEEPRRRELTDEDRDFVDELLANIDDAEIRAAAKAAAERSLMKTPTVKPTRPASRR